MKKRKKTDFQIKIKSSEGVTRKSDKNRDTKIDKNLLDKREKERKPFQNGIEQKKKTVITFKKSDITLKNLILLLLLEIFSFNNCWYFNELL